MKTRCFSVLALLCGVAFATAACSSSDDDDSSSNAGAAGASGGSGGASGGGGGASGGGADDFPSIGLDTDARMLTPAQAGELCDWINKSLGGYGLHTDCGSKNVSNDDNQAQCMAARLQFTCKVTVSQVKTCILAEVPSHYCEIDSKACGPLFCN